MTEIDTEGDLVRITDVGIDFSAVNDTNDISVACTPNNDNFFRKAYLGDWEYDKDDNKGEDKMCSCEDSCDVKSDSKGYDEDLSQKIINLDLADDERKLRRHGLVGRTGLITRKGEEVLLNHLLRKHSAEILQNIEAVAEAELEYEE